MNLILLGIIVAAVILVGILVAVSYVKCPPDMVFLISGIKKEPRVITGKAAFRIPFFERIDKIPLKLIQIDVRANRVPTNDFINVDVDAVANVRISTKNELIQIAAKHFLNQTTKDIAANVQQILEGNMREIIGQMILTDLVNNKQLFSQKIQENAIDDIEKLGLEIVNLNVQNVTDDNDAIVNLGVDNLAQIQKNAKIARAQAEKEVEVAEAAADEEGARARAVAEAEGIEKKAEAQKKMGEASIVEMIMNALPQVAKEVSAPLANVDNITMYGDQSTKLIENNTQKIDQVLKVAQDSLGLDLKSLIAGFAANKIIQDNKKKSDE